ncbi:hypothetical protein NliqN6_2964 [Naganishia liquefaciens]|uniref:Uncharacterized protein n=1 Tax=Naganishia liquefaciens TaxID=104408 RepID=A0A8H3YFU4_9TREE|nr:hypothetical protein NliqN6_2964 [Naganishia liquefaciens]
MRIFPLLAFILAYLNLVAAAEQKSSTSAFQNICQQISKLRTCKTTLSLPEVVVVKGKINWVKWNGCKNKIRLFGGWTCAGGYDKGQIEGPVGVKVNWKKYAICDMARKNIPNYADIMDRATGMCKCIPQALEGLDDQTTKAVFTSGDVGASSAKVLQKYYALESCYVDAAMAVKDNKAGLTQGNGQLVTKPGTMIFRAAELDTSRYAAFATALAPCFVGACDPDAIIGFFTNYLRDSEEAIKDELSALFKPWTSSANSLSNAFDQIVNVTSGIGAQIDQVEKDVKTLVDDFCSSPAVCANNTLEGLRTQVESTLDVAKQIAQLDAIVKSASTSVREIGTVISAGSDAIDAVSDLGVAEIVQKVEDGSFRKIEELAGALKAAQHLPQIISDIQKQSGQLTTVVSELQAKGPQFVDSVQKIVGQNWLENYDKADAAAADRLSKQVQQVQNLMTRLVPQATQLYASATFLIDSLSSVSVQRDLDVQLDLGVASYQRQTSGWFHMPCLTTGTLSYNLFGFKGSIDYPKFYRCKQNYKIPFPNQHIPYVRLRMPSDALLARLGGTLPSGSTTSISVVSAQAQVATAAPSSASPTTASSIATTFEASSASSSTFIVTVSTSAESSTRLEESSTSPSTSAVASTSSESVSESITQESATPTPTTAPVRRERVRPFNPAKVRRQSAEEDTPDVIPPDETLSADLPGGFFTDTAQASAAARETIPSTILFTSTTINGQATTVSLAAIPTGAPISTEVEPDPTLAGSDFSIAETFAIATDLTTTSLDEDMTTWTPLGTVALDTDLPSITPGPTTPATSTSTPTSTTTATTGGNATSGGEHLAYAGWFTASIALLFSFWLI